MTAELVRLPDQFRPARSTPTAATPTCCCSCCCCCCCAATLISASVVLPMQVEILARRRMVGDPRADVPPRPPPDDLRSRKVLAALAPSLAIVGWILVSMNDHPTLGALTVPAVLGGLSYVAFSEFPRRGARAATNAAVIIAAFAVEFVLGLVLILGTFGIGYLILLVMVPVLVIGFFTRRRDALPPRDAMRPPPFPWPQEG